MGHIVIDDGCGGPAVAKGGGGFRASVHEPTRSRFALARWAIGLGRGEKDQGVAIYRRGGL